MTSDIETKTKSIIRSLLTSSPLVLTVRKLQVDYRNTIGEEIPYQRIGYASLEHFLQSIPDTCSIRGYGPNASVLPVVTAKTAHINEMVTRQKIVKKGKQFMMARPKNGPVPKMQYPTKPVERPPLMVPSLMSIDLKSLRVPPIVKEKEPPIHTEPKPEINHQKNSIQPPAEKTTNHKTEQPVEKIAKPTNNINISVSLQRELRQIISNIPEGIWCAELPQYYRNKFKKKLDYEYYGYRRLIELCKDLPEIFHCTRPGMCDYMLYDVNKPQPVDVKKDTNNCERICSQRESSISNLDWLDCSPLIPSDVCKLGHVISKEFVPEGTKQNDQFRVVVVEIYDPSKFWIYLYASPLNDMMNEMQVFYQAQKDDYMIPEFLLVDGLYCVQIIYNEYHRALIVDSMPDTKGQVKLLYIDYGTLSKAPSQGICFLHKKFANLPWQQIRCRLANIVPVEDGAPWPQEARKRFCQLINQRELEIKISSIDWEEKILDIFLADVTDQTIFYINDVLVDEGYALTGDKERVKSEIKIGPEPIVKNLHLFPTFDELENGLAPSGTEMSGFGECEVPLNFAMPQYFRGTSDERAAIETNTWLIENFQDEFSKCIPHDYDIQAICKVGVNFEVFGEYGKAVIEELGYFCEEFEEVEIESEVIEEAKVENDTEHVVNDHNEVLETIDSNYILSEELLEDLAQLSDGTEYTFEAAVLQNKTKCESVVSDDPSDDYVLKTSSFENFLDLDNIKEFVPNGVQTNPFLNLNESFTTDSAYHEETPKQHKKPKKTNPFLPSDSSSSDPEVEPEIEHTAEMDHLIRSTTTVSSWKRYKQVKSCFSSNSSNSSSEAMSSQQMAISEDSLDTEEVVVENTMPEVNDTAASGFNGSYNYGMQQQRHFMPRSVVYNSTHQYTYLDPYVPRPPPGFPPMVVPPNPCLMGGYFAYPYPRPQFCPPTAPYTPHMVNPQILPWSDMDMFNTSQEDFYSRYNQHLLQKQSQKK